MIPTCRVCMGFHNGAQRTTCVAPDRSIPSSHVSTVARSTTASLRGSLKQSRLREQKTHSVVILKSDRFILVYRIRSVREIDNIGNDLA
jgi:hypothetical protein